MCFILPLPPSLRLCPPLLQKTDQSNMAPSLASASLLSLAAIAAASASPSPLVVSSPAKVPTGASWSVPHDFASFSFPAHFLKDYAGTISLCWKRMPMIALNTRPKLQTDPIPCRQAKLMAIPQATPRTLISFPETSSIFFIPRPGLTLSSE